jgi:hypothetical protein
LQLRSRCILLLISRRLRQELFELRYQLIGIAEELNDMIPDDLLQGIRLDAGPGTLRLPCRGQGVRSGAAIVAPADAASMPGKVAPVDPQTAGAALQKASQQVVVLLVATE